MQLRIFTKIHQPMKNPLLKHKLIRISQFELRLLNVMILTLVMFAGMLKAQVVNKTECSCLNNATNNTNGQYLERFSFSGTPGHVWRLEGPIVGFYHPASLPPPVAPILYLIGTQIPEISPGQFSIEGKRISGQPWSVYIRNVNTGVLVHVFSIQNCRYPSHPVAVNVTGDSIVCTSALLSNYAYSLAPAPPDNTYHNVLWTIASGGSISGANNLDHVLIQWGPTPGIYSLKATGNQTSYAGQPVGCNFSVSKNVTIIDPAVYTRLRGDFGNCVGAVEQYTISAALNQLDLPNITWGVYTDPAGLLPASGVTVTNPGGTARTRTIQWPNTPGVYYIVVTGGFRLIPSDPDFCFFRTISRVDIVNEPLLPIACNNNVNISMNPSCEMSFSPDQFLEGQLFPNSSYDIMIRDIEADTIVPNGTLGFKYVGKKLEVKVIHECSGNSCWSYAKIEDKSIPDMVCPPDVTITCDNLNDLSVTGFPVLPTGANSTPVSGTTDSWIVNGFDKCSNVLLKYTDKVINNACTGPYSSVITRTWSIRDDSGNESVCSQTISVNRASLIDVVMPNNFDSATGPNPSLEACDNWPKIAYVVNGSKQTYVDKDGVIKIDSVPDPAFTGYPIGTLCMNASVSYTDKKILLCGTNPHSYKLIRKWKVIDYCADPANNVIEKNQLITVMDTKAPVITCPADLTTQTGPGPVKPAAVVVTKAHQCVGDWVVLPPVAIYDCMPTTWKVEFKLADASGNPPVGADFVSKDGATEVKGTYNTYTIVNLPKGRTWIRYTVTDLCGNFAYCFTEVDVVDNEPPVPVCDRHSVVAIGSNGEGLAGVLTFDDGSHDNCGIVCMKIRRMDNPVAWSQIECDNKLKFTCNDIGPGKTVQVELGVWDAAGLFNTCMVEAKVQDNIFPVLSIPADVTANCNEDFTSLTRFGNATATDNCSVTVKEERLDSLNECNLGRIVRLFTATDQFGNKSTKKQVITVLNKNPFTFNDIDWPDTYTVNSGCYTELTPDKLPVLYSKPRYFRNTDCAQLISSYEDIVFNFADNVCVKILRKWKVVDWCQRNPFAPGSGEWTYTQLIMVNNVKGPDIISGCSSTDISYTQVGQCQAKVTVSAVADDDCTPEDKLEWSYIIDEYNDGTIDVANGTGRKIDRVFPYGTHKITWIVKDGCKNESRCSNVFTIKDDKKPTPYCLTEIGTVIMPSAKEVSIWASDFNRGSSDNCTSPDNIVASFSPTNRNDKSRTITCADMDGLAIKKFTFDVYYIDEAGNSDFCTVALYVQDNDGVCKKQQTRASVKGSIYTENDVTLKDVQVDIMSVQPEFPKSVNTNQDGLFLFSDLLTDNDYTLAPVKNDDILNGVTTLDLVMIQRHILGIESLNSPYKYIAADINNSSNISASDLSELRKVILGIKDGFNNNNSWRFVDAGLVFSDPSYPYPVKETLETGNLTKNIGGKDFIAVKIGDVNESAQDGSIMGDKVSSRSTVSMKQSTVNGKAGDVVEVAIGWNQTIDIAGTQFSLAFDPESVDLIDAKTNGVINTDDNVSYRNIENGLIHVSWNSYDPVSMAGNLMTFRFRLKQAYVNQPVLSLYNGMIHPEVYSKEGDKFVIHNLSLELRSGETLSEDRFEVYQNIPNPFNAVTQIGFNLPETSDVTFKVFDVTGKVLLQQQTLFKKGYNTINFDAGSISSTGVLYYVIETNKYSATRKMIIIK